MKTKSRISILVLLVLSAALLSGCRKEDKRRDFEQKGTVLEVDQNTGVVEFQYYNKDGERRQRKGKLAPDAEILINGVTAGMQDVKIGEDITVRGYIDRVGGEPRIVATTVIVTREEGITIDQATKPSP
jgi:hypothetical protein